MHEHLRGAGEPERRRPDASTSARPPVPGGLTAQAVLALQRSAGNASLAPRLARRPSATMPPSQDGATPGGDGLRFLPEEGRARLRAEAGPFIALAYTTFNKACAAHAAALHAAASADAEFLALVIGVVAGALAPALAKWTTQSGVALAERVAEDAETRPDVIKMFTNQKLVETEFTLATRVGVQEMRNSGVLLPGETSTDRYLDSLSDAFDKGAHALIGHLYDMTDLQLAAVWLAYSYEHTSYPVYREEIGYLLRQFDRYVTGQEATAIGAELPPAGAAGADVVEDVALIAQGARRRQRRVYMAELHGRPRAILVLRDDKDVEPPRFRGYVPKAVEALAKARTVELFGAVETIDPNLLYGGIPDPPGRASWFDPGEPDEPAGA